MQAHRTRSHDQLCSWARGASAGYVRSGMLPWGLALIAGLAGCSGLEPVAQYEPTTDPAQLFMTLAIDHPAVTLDMAAGYNTAQLTATPLNALGEPIAGLPAPTFHLEFDTDSTTVTVTPSGLLTAKAETAEPGVFVVAELRTGANVLRTDTALVTVTALGTPPVLTSFSVDPVPPDSTIRAMAGLNTGFVDFVLQIAGLAPQPFVVPQALDAADNPISGLATRYSSLNPQVADVSLWDGRVNFLQPGQVQLVAQTTAYGVTKVDTTALSVTFPIAQLFWLQVDNGVITNQANWPQRDVRIAPHGYVFWIFENGNGESVSMDIMFDDGPAPLVMPPDALCIWMARFRGIFGPAPHCDTGDISFPLPPTPGSSFIAGRVRQFAAPGIYTYHMSTGVTGRIIVE